MTLRMIGLSAAMAFTCLASSAVAAPPPGIPDGWSDGFVYVNGARIHYYHARPQPGKPVIVMLHGATDIGLSWTTLTKELEKSYDIYMPDTRSHGLSDPLTDADNADTLVKDAVGFVQAMKFNKPILMGHSLGAATVIRVGAEYPDLPRAVIMLDPAVGGAGPPAPPPPPAPAAAAAAVAARRPGSMNMSGSPEEVVAANNDTFENFVAACAQQNQMWDPVDCQYWALSKKQYRGVYTPAQMQALRGPMSSSTALAKITVPALILKADASPEVRERNLKGASVLKNGKLVHIDGAKHNLHHDKRARTVEVLTEFLNKL